MKYIGTPNFNHDQVPRVGILLTNLGSMFGAWISGAAIVRKLMG